MKTRKPHPESKPRRTRRSVSVEILRSRFAIFAEAADELARRTKQPVSAEDVIVFMLERECDPNDLADIYCWRVLKWSHEEIDRFSDHALGRSTIRRRKRAAAV